MNHTAARRSPAPPRGQAAPSHEFVSDTWFKAEDNLFFRARSERRRIGFVRQGAYVAIDITLACLGAIIIYGARFGFSHHLGFQIAPLRELVHQAHTHTYPAFLVLYVALIVMACMSQHLYRTSREISALEESLTVGKAVGLATVLLVLFIFISGNKEISRLVVASAGVMNVGTLAGWRYSKRRYVLRRARRAERISRPLIIGAGKLGQTLATWLENNQHLGY